MQAGAHLVGISEPTEEPRLSYQVAQMWGKMGKEKSGV